MKLEHELIKLQVVKIERFSINTLPDAVTVCRLETWYDAHGRYHVLVTERGDNPGPSLGGVDTHQAMRKGIEEWLHMLRGMDYSFYEKWERSSYKPPRDDGDEISRVTLIDDAPGVRWEFIPDDEWEKIYVEPRQKKPKTKRREKK